MAPSPTLFISHLAPRDALEAVEFGRSPDGQFKDCWLPVGDDAAFLLDEVDGEIVGFGVRGLSTFDVDDPRHAPFWSWTRFSAPMLGLADVSAAEIILAVRPFLSGRRTLNRRLFDTACDLRQIDPLRAKLMWIECLETGDAMAHFGLGCALFDLGEFPAAYRHLRHYTEIAPANPWNWRWYGAAAEAVGEPAEAIAAWERALELSDHADDTDAAALLSTLLATREIRSESDE